MCVYKFHNLKCYRVVDIVLPTIITTEISTNKYLDVFDYETHWNKREK